MPGAIYKRNLRLARAYAAGFDAAIDAVDPFDPAVDPDAYAAWEAGYLQSCDKSDPDADFGVDWHTGGYWCAEGGPGGN